MLIMLAIYGHFGNFFEKSKSSGMLELKRPTCHHAKLILNAQGFSFPDVVIVLADGAV